MNKTYRKKAVTNLTDLIANSPRTIEDDLARQDEKIHRLEKQVLEAERTLAVLIAAGHLAQSTVDEARSIVQGLLWANKA
ncbi:MAG: hypothetical protein U0Y68_18395 [Blastocatellia bacterium]